MLFSARKRFQSTARRPSGFNPTGGGAQGYRQKMIKPEKITIKNKKRKKKKKDVQAFFPFCGSSALTMN